MAKLPTISNIKLGEGTVMIEDLDLTMHRDTGESVDPSGWKTLLAGPNIYTARIRRARPDVIPGQWHKLVWQDKEKTVIARIKPRDQELRGDRKWQHCEVDGVPLITYSGR